MAGAGWPHDLTPNAGGEITRAIAAACDIPAERVGHQIVLARDLSHDSLWQVMACCPDTWERLPVTLRLIADQLEARGRASLS
jgi:hypothetical protein